MLLRTHLLRLHGISSVRPAACDRLGFGSRGRRYAAYSRTKKIKYLSEPGARDIVTILRISPLIEAILLAVCCSMRTL